MPDKGMHASVSWCKLKLENCRSRNAERTGRQLRSSPSGVCSLNTKQDIQTENGERARRRILLW